MLGGRSGEGAGASGGVRPAASPAAPRHWPTREATPPGRARAPNCLTTGRRRARGRGGARGLPQCRGARLGARGPVATDCCTSGTRLLLPVPVPVRPPTPPKMRQSVFYKTVGSLRLQVTYFKVIKSRRQPATPPCLSLNHVPRFHLPFAYFQGC